MRPEQDDATVAKGAKLRRGQHAYATLKTGTDGLTLLDELHTEPPASGDFVRVTIRWASEGKAHIEWPFDRFYLNEALAPEADKWFAESIRGSKGVIAEVRVHHGTAVLAMLIGQARPSFRALFGIEPPDVDVRRIALQALEREA